MKKLIFFLLIMLAVSVRAQNLTNDDIGKTAILMVHFGTTVDETREVTIDAINDKVKASFPDITVVEAYTSRIIINRLAKRGVMKDTPEKALLRLAADGYTRVIVQGTNVIDGIEAEVLRQEVALMAPFFTEIRVGRPLLYSIEDCEKTVEVLKTRYGTHAGKDKAVVLIGHGTSTPANAIYSQVDYMFGACDAGNFHVATVEGYPTYQTTVARLEKDRIKNVCLVPFMFVAGDHARNDINVDWRERLDNDGFRTSAIIEGLGQIPEIQDIYIEHIKAAMSAPVMDAAAQKAGFIKENM
ncbi:MAG: sirohydrochlorin cobaltochelatase [Muribaculaceae bacterium]|nr:sirohydrochlorin cobaltochelatase [Muribaculaceae bacterium]